MTREEALAAVRAAPKDPHAWLTLGNMLVQEGDKAKAKECYERALALDPLLSEAHQALGELEKPAPSTAVAKPKRTRKPKTTEPPVPEPPPIIIEHPVDPPRLTAKRSLLTDRRTAPEEPAPSPQVAPPPAPPAKPSRPKPVVILVALLTMCICGSMIFADPEPEPAAVAPSAPDVTQRAEPTTEQSAATVQARTRNREATARALVAAATEGAAPTATPDPATVAAAPSATPEPAPPATVPLVSVVNPELNARGGPGTDYPILVTLKQGDTVPALGYSPDRNWVQVVLPDGQKGWVSSGAQFVTVSLAETLPISSDFAALPTQPPAVVQPTAPPAAGGNCHPSYPDVCIPPAPPDLDCGDIAFRRFRVLPPDPHGFDREGDGLGCES